MRWETCALNCSTPRDQNNDGSPIYVMNRCEGFTRVVQTFTVDDPPVGPCFANRTYTPGVGCPVYEYPGAPGCGSGANRITSSVVFSDPAEPCSPALYDEFDDPNITAYEFRSKAGIEIDRVMAPALYLLHHPSPTCYLKVWVRFKIQWWRLASYTGSDYGDYADHLAAEPYWCNQFEEDGEPEWQEALAPYEWIGSGERHCLLDPTKPPGDEDNIIDTRTDDAWIPSLQVEMSPEDGIYGWSVAAFEVKYSFVEGFEPPWPSEEAGCSGFPSPSGCENQATP